jgi:hypothetical protein
VRGVTDAEAELLSTLIAFPAECAMCEPICAKEIATVGDGDRRVGDALARDGRAVIWPCKHTTWRHGRITETGRLALRLRHLVTA